MAKRRTPTPRCLHCGKPLPYFLGPTDQARWARAYPDQEIPPLTRGVDGMGYFCIKRRAIAFAHRAARKMVERNSDGTKAGA